MPTGPTPVRVMIDTTDLGCELIAAALRQAAEQRRTAALRASAELESERLSTGRDIRTDAQRIVRTLAEADMLFGTAEGFTEAYAITAARESAPVVFDVPSDPEPSGMAPLETWSPDAAVALADVEAEEARLADGKLLEEVDAP